jgi:hypothetical protein
MSTLDEMLKKIVLAGRDEGFMEPGDNVSATGEVLVIFSGNEQVYDEDLDQEIADENNEIYDIYIHVDATTDDFEYPSINEFLGIEISVNGMIHIRAVYEVASDYLHANPIEDYIENAEGVTLSKIKKVIEASFEAVDDE